MTSPAAVAGERCMAASRRRSSVTGRVRPQTRTLRPGRAAQTPCWPPTWGRLTGTAV